MCIGTAGHFHFLCRGVSDESWHLLSHIVTFLCSAIFSDVVPTCLLKPSNSSFPLPNRNINVRKLFGRPSCFIAARFIALTAYVFTKHEPRCSVLIICSNWIYVPCWLTFGITSDLWLTAHMCTQIDKMAMLVANPCVSCYCRGRLTVALIVSNE